MRHAEATPVAASDVDRALTPRGRRQSREIGARLLAGHPVAPLLAALVSPARRALETFAGLGLGVTPTIERGIFDAETDDLLTLLREVDGDPPGVLLVGHNPGIQGLAATLSAGPDPRLSGFPPGTCCVLETGGGASRTADLVYGCCHVVEVLYPAA